MTERGFGDDVDVVESPEEALKGTLGRETDLNVSDHPINERQTRIGMGRTATEVATALRALGAIHRTSPQSRRVFVRSSQTG